MHDTDMMPTSRTNTGMITRRRKTQKHNAAPWHHVTMNETGSKRKFF